MVSSLDAFAAMSKAQIERDAFREGGSRGR